MNNQRSLRGLRGAPLDVLAPGPPEAPNEVWFFDDLSRIDRAELQDLRRVYQLQLLLTPPHERDLWTNSWVEARLQWIEEELRGRSDGR